jgi:RimJ/RimL family protein N-acetyltransferase
MINFVEVYRSEGTTPGAVEFLHKLLGERPAAANISHVRLPSLEEHRQFVDGKPYHDWLIVEADGKWVGSLHQTKWNAIGVAILEAHQRKGYAGQAIQKYVSTHAPLPAVPSIRRGAFIINVAPENEACKALVKYLGGKLIHLTYEV